LAKVLALPWDSGAVQPLFGKGGISPKCELNGFRDPITERRNIPQTDKIVKASGLGRKISK
jgi:hypothetical protein